MDEFIAQLNEKNLCTWYLLPLIGLNCHSFGGGNFIDSYILSVESEPTLRLLAVSVRDFRICKELVHHPRFYGNTTFEDGGTVMIFSIQEKWREDYQLFIEGKYSRMSIAAKEEIKQYSGLKYQVQESPDMTPITDAVLMALDKNTALKNYWLEELEIPESSLPDEYLSLPRPQTFLVLKGSR